MKLFLQSSSGQPSLALWDRTVVFERQFEMMERVDYRQELESALDAAGIPLSAMTGIIIDIGPGRLGATRSAVAFANGLGFALGIPLLPLNAFQILGTFGEASFNRSCLVLRKAARRQYHWALVQGGKITEAGFGTEATVVTDYTGSVVVVGDGDSSSVSLPTLPDAIWPELTLAPASALEGLDAQLHPANGPIVPLIDSKGVADVAR